MVLKPLSARFSFLITVTVLLFVQSTYAQYSKRRSGTESSWEFGFSGGVSQFLTSINPNVDAEYKKFNYWNADFNPSITQH